MIRRFLVIIPLIALLLSPNSARADDDFAAKEQRLNEAAGKVRTLSDELAVLTASVEVSSTVITDLNRQIASVERSIRNLNIDLGTLQRQRLGYQRTLGRYVAADYTDLPSSIYVILASEGSVTDRLAINAYLSTLQDSAHSAMLKLKDTEAALDAKRREMLDTSARLDDLKLEQSTRATELAATKDAKQRLLERTQGDEAAFRADFESAREELEKAGRFAKSARDRVGSRVWDDSGYYYNQLDSRWIDSKLGFSNSSTLGDYGCGVTALAMVFKYYGIQTDPVKLNVRLKETRAFVDDLMDWRGVAAATNGRLELANSPYPIGQSTVDWNFINQQLASGNPVIVYINRPGQQSHYVVLLSKQGDSYLMHDPIEGPYLLFGKYYSTSAVYQYITFRRT